MTGETEKPVDSKCTSYLKLKDSDLCANCNGKLVDHENKPVTPEPAKPVETEKPATPKPEVPEVKPETPQTGPKNIAWDEAFIFFCTPVDGKYPTLVETAKKFGVSDSTVNKRAMDEKWTDKRKANVGKAQEDFLKDREVQIKDANARHLKRWRKAQQLADSLFKMFKARVDKYREAQAKIVELEKIRQSSADTIPDKGTANTKPLKDLEKEIAELGFFKLPSEHRLLSIVNILKTSVEGERIVLGLPIIVSKTDITSDGERVILPPELIAEIDNLARKNEPPKSPGPGNN